MKEKSLANTNPHLTKEKKDNDKFVTNVASSTAVETGKPVSTVAKRVNQLRSVKPSE